MKSLKRIPSLVLLFGILVTGISSQIEAQEQQPERRKAPTPKFDSQFIPESAVGGALAYPAYMASQDGLELLPWEIISAFGKQEFGIDPLTIKQVVSLVDEIKDGENPSFGFALHFDEPAKLSDSATAGLDEEDYRGMRFFRAPYPMSPSILIVDDVTMLIGTEDFIKEMSMANQKSSRLVKLMQSVDSKTALSAYVVIEPMREMINRQIEGVSDQIPPPFQPFLEIPNMLESAVWVQEMGGEFKSRLTLYTEGADEAEQLDKIVMDGLAMGKQMLLAQMAQQMDMDDPVQAATVQYTNRIGGFVQKQLTPVRNGNQLVFEASQGMASTPMLIAMLLPAVQQTRSAARRVDTQNRVRQLALAMHNFTDANGAFPTNIYDEDGKPLLSWRVQLLPYIEEGNLYDEFHLDEPWDSTHNKKLIERMPAFLRSPDVSLPPGHTNFLAMSGKNTLFDGPEKVRFEDIRDGASNTVLYVEVDPDQALEWTRPTDLKFDPRNPKNGLASFRPAGFITAFCDGSTHVIAKDIDDERWKSMVLPNDDQ